MKSEMFSFEGWNLGSWIKGNKDLLEQACKLIPAVIAWLVTQKPAWAIGIGLFGKLAIDSIQYFMKEYK